MTTQPRSLRIAPPGELVRAYAPHAQSCEVPDFCVVLTPQTTYGPSRAVIVARMPHEAGPAFHARACKHGHKAAECLGETAESVCLFFTPVLPPVAWRQRWAQIQGYRWQLAMADTPEVCRRYAEAKLAEMGVQA